jgi:cytoskeletal protein RodZ
MRRRRPREAADFVIGSERLLELNAGTFGCGDGESRIHEGSAGASDRGAETREGTDAEGPLVRESSELPAKHRDESETLLNPRKQERHHTAARFRWGHAVVCLTTLAVAFASFAVFSDRGASTPTAPLAVRAAPPHMGSPGARTPERRPDSQSHGQPGTRSQTSPGERPSRRAPVPQAVVANPQPATPTSSAPSPPSAPSTDEPPPPDPTAVEDTPVAASAAEVRQEFGP